MTTEQITVRADSNTPPELRELISKSFQKDPEKKALGALRLYVDTHPGLLSQTLSLAKITQDQLINKTVDQPAVQTAVRDELAELRRGLGFDQAPEIERLLIHNIENCYLRLQWVEMQLTGYMGIGTRASDLQLWERRLTAAQNRHLRAIETLARVRKLTSPLLQVNIAQEGGQQVNVAGDLKRG